MNGFGSLDLYLGQAVGVLEFDPRGSGMKEGSACLFYPSLHIHCCQISKHLPPHPALAEGHAAFLPGRIIFHLDARATCLTSSAAVPFPRPPEKAQLSLLRGRGRRVRECEVS